MHPHSSGNAAVKPSYRQDGRWRQYQRFMPERIRLTADWEPAESWWSWRGAEIHLDRLSAAGAPATVILLHGGGGNGRLLMPFGRMLHAHGLDIVAPDLPGYGLSITRPEQFSYERWVDCTADLVEAESKRTGKPVVLFGMSLGGYLAYLAAAQGRRAAGVIATTLADPRLPIVRDQFANSPRFNRMVAPLLPAASTLFGNLRLPVKWFSNMYGISNQPELAAMLASDPAGGGNRIPVRFMRSLLEIQPAIEPEQFDVCPVLLAHPAADRWTTPECSLPFFDRIAGPKQLVMLDNCGHMPIEEPGLSQLEQAAVELIDRACAGCLALPQAA